MRISQLTLAKVGPFEKATLRFPKRKDPNHAELHIFTGPNGCGKSTLLFALAALFGESNGALKRSWHEDHSYLLGLALDGPTLAYVGLYDPVFRSIPAANIETGIWPLVRSNPEVTQFLGQACEPIIQEAKTQTVPALGSSAFHLGSGFRQALSGQKLSFAAFAYSGARALTDHKLRTIREMDRDPLEKMLHFPSMPNSEDLFQWITTTKAKAALEQVDYQPGSAQHFHNALGKLDHALSEMIGASVRFVLQTRPLHLRFELDGQVLDMGILPDGLKSIICWLGDLIMRLDLIPWDNQRDIFSQKFLLLLDEIDIHLHPAWQRKVLPVLQTLFPNAQIFCTTHSPFVVNSVDDAWIHSIQLESQKAVPQEAVPSQAARSYASALTSIFGVKQRFGPEVEKRIDNFYALRSSLMAGDRTAQERFFEMGRSLAEASLEVRNIVIPEIRQMEKVLDRSSRL